MSIAGAIGILALLVLLLQGTARFFKAPMRFLATCFCCMVLALGALCLFNLLGAYWQIRLPINWFTVGMVALFRIPGLLAVAALQLLLI